MNKEALATILASHKEWLRGEAGERADLRRADLRGASLHGADLSGASLHGADLSGASLSGASLSGASLSGADLRRADLRRADLRGASLHGASLHGADLSGASLSGASLSGAILSGASLSGATILPTGETWAAYLAEVVPAYLTAGGKTVAEIVAKGAWGCNDWTNCPTAVAFGVHHLDSVPLLLRPRAEQFIQLFDAHLIPEPVAAGKPSAPEVGA